MDKKIYLYSDVVHDMKVEFKQRLQTKRLIIHKMKHLCKEYSLRDVTLLCAKCDHEVSLLKTVEYKSDDYHHAKCVFGLLKRVEIAEAVNDPLKYYQDQDNKDFIELYTQIFDEKNKASIAKSEPSSTHLKTNANN